MESSPTGVLAIDTGGTFTDYVGLDGEGRVRSGKVPSTPENPARSIREILDTIPLDASATLLHGTTVATNALLEGDLAPVVLVTNEGLGGLLRIGRGTRRELFELCPDPEQDVFRDVPVVEVPLREHPLDGGSETRLAAEEARRLRAEVREHSPDAVAVCLVHSYADGSAERRVGEALEELDAEVLLSREVLPRFREYERAATTAVNAGLRPRVSRYIQELAELEQTPERLLIMGSDRGVLDPGEVVERPTLAALSGPTGGLVAARTLTPGEGGVISMDIGGTSTDVCLIEGRIPLRDDHTIGGFPIAQPMVDMHTVGSGGGSVLWLDRGNHLRVGPRSAGADPGPACYGRGGPPTITDAQVALGRIPVSRPLSEELSLSRETARTSLEELGASVGMSWREVARGALRIGRSQLAEAVRSVTVQRGRRPDDFPLFAFGGAGGLYAAELAEELGLGEIYVPRRAGVASATGLLEAPRHLQRSISPVRELTDRAQPLPEISQLTERQPPWAGRDTDFYLEAECRFRGQSHALTVPVEADHAERSLREEFRDRYRDTFGYTPAESTVELVHLNAYWQQPLDTPVPDPRPGGDRELETRVPVRVGDSRESVPMSSLEDWRETAAGPRLLSGQTTTLYVPPGWRVEPAGALLVRMVPRG